MEAAVAQRKQGGLLSLLVAYSAFVVLGMPDGLLGVAWPSMRAQFGVSLEAFGLLLLPSTLAYMVTSTISGRLIAWRGIGAFLMVGALIRIAGLLGFATAPGWGLLLLSSLIFGIGTGAVDTGFNTYVASNYSAGRLSWLHAAFGLGATIGPLIMTALLAASRRWQTGYLLVAVAQGVILLAMLAVRRDWQLPVSDDASREAGGSAVPVWALLRIPAVLLAIGVFFLYVGVEVTGGNWTFTLFTEARQIPETTAGMWISIYWASLAIGRVITGVVVDRLGTVRVLRWSMIGVVIGSALIAVNAAPAISFLGLALVGFAEASIFPSMIAIVPERFGAANAPNIIGFQMGAAGLGYALIPGLAGILAARIGLEVVGPYMVLVGLLMWVCFEAGIYLVPVRKV
jgi:fucose permease